MYSPRFIGWSRVAALLAVLSALLSATVPFAHRAQAVTAHSLTRMHTMDTIAVAYPVTPQSLDPAIIYDLGGPAVLRNVYDTLVTLKGSSPTEVIGNLASSWSSNATKTVWTFYLHHGVHFHDGTLLDANAVKSGIVRTLMVNQAPAFILGQFLTPDRITVLGRYTMRFSLLPKSPVYAFLNAMTSQWGNMIVSPTAVERHATASDPYARNWFATHEDGSGPYTLVYAPNQTATFTAFPQYFKGWSGHHARKVIMSFITQDATRRDLLEHGDADLSLYFTPQDLDAMRKEPGLVVQNQYGTSSYFITFTEYGPLASVEARQALTYAFNYRAYVDDLLRGYGRPATGPMAATVLGHDPHLKPPVTDLARARALLQKAGVKPGTVLTMWYISSDEREKALAQVMQGQLAQIGLVAQLVPRDVNTFDNVLFSDSPGPAQRPNLWASSWSPDYDDPLDFMAPLYHSKGQSVLGGASNGGFYHNKTVDQLLERASHTLDASTRQTMLNRVQEILTTEDPAGIFAADVTENPVVRSNVHGFVINQNLTETFYFYALWKS